MTVVLQAEKLTMRFGGLVAVDEVALEVRQGQIVSIIGPNGAGKTTVFNCLSGFYKPTAGTVEFHGENIASMKDFQIARRGLVRTFQHVRLFKKLSVLENLLVAQHQNVNTNLLSGIFKTQNFRTREQQAIDTAMTWLGEVNLQDHANTIAENLSYGQQRRLEIARAMVTQPSLLLLDEPAAGLNPRETQELDALILRLRDHFKVSILLIEHDMSLVMGISDYIYVINQGAPLAEGKPEAVANDQRVIQAYLGES